jgi:WD40 repeat protein
MTRVKDVRRLAYSPDGRFLAGLRQHDVVIWNAETLTARATLQPSGVRDRFRSSAASIVCMAFTPDGRRLAVGCMGDFNVHKPGMGQAKTSFFDTATWQKQPDLNCECDAVYDLVFCKDGRLIAGTVFEPTIWDAKEY